MTGPKLNEKNRQPWGTKGGTAATAKYVRMSASKARVVLNLVRDKDVQRADEILQFTDREAARVVRKVLASAVANAVHNDELQADDLFVKACFADEGPTLKLPSPRPWPRRQDQQAHLPHHRGGRRDERAADDRA
jgi:large subunit ribosomal protein L22